MKLRKLATLLVAMAVAALLAGGILWTAKRHSAREVEAGANVDHSASVKELALAMRAPHATPSESAVESGSVQQESHAAVMAIESAGEDSAFLSRLDELAAELQSGTAALDDLITATHMFVEALNPAAPTNGPSNSIEVPVTYAVGTSSESGVFRITHLPDGRLFLVFEFERPALPCFRELSDENTLQLQVSFTIESDWRAVSCGALVQNLLHHTKSALDRLREKAPMHIGGAYQVYWREGEWITDWRPLLLNADSSGTNRFTWTTSSGASEHRPRQTLETTDVASRVAMLQSVTEMIEKAKGE